MWKLKHGCQWCGFNDGNPAKLCFAHRPGTVKHDLTKNGKHPTMNAGGIDQLTDGDIPVSVLVDEMRKCDVLCHNCHMGDTHPNLAYVAMWKEKQNDSKKDYSCDPCGP
jgi:hypothetical protein